MGPTVRCCSAVHVAAQLRVASGLVAHRGHDWLEHRKLIEPAQACLSEPRWPARLDRHRLQGVLQPAHHHERRRRKTESTDSAARVLVPCLRLCFLNLCLELAARSARELRIRIRNLDES